MQAKQLVESSRRLRGWKERVYAVEGSPIHTWCDHLHALIKFFQSQVEPRLTRVELGIAPVHLLDAIQH